MAKSRISVREYTEFLFDFYSQEQDETLGSAFLNTFFPEIDDPELRRAAQRRAQDLIMDNYVYFGTGSKGINDEDEDY